MKTTFKLFGLVEIDFLTVRKHQMDFDSEHEAFDYIKQHTESFEHGFEIVKTYSK